MCVHWQLPLGTPVQLRFDVNMESASATEANGHAQDDVFKFKVKIRMRKRMTLLSISELQASWGLIENDPKKKKEAALLMAEVRGE